MKFNSIPQYFYRLVMLFVAAVFLFIALFVAVQYQQKSSVSVEASTIEYSEEITDITERIEGNLRIVTEHHANARIPFITVYKYPFIDEVTGAAVPPPQSLSGTNYYRVISTDSAEDTGDEVCAIALNTSCNGYVDESVTGFNICKAFHPTAAEVTDTDGDVSVTYCNGGPQAAPCSTLSNTCLACPDCTNGVACNESIAGLYREMYVTCATSTAVGVDLCNEPLDDDDGSGDGIVDLTASETSYDNGSIIIDGCTVAIDGDHTFTNVTVRRNGVLTQSVTGTGTINRTNLTVTGHTEIAIGSSIYGDGRGAAGNYHIDPAVSTTNAQAGAKNSHGGAGDSDPTEIYGDYTDPIWPGSGGTKVDGAGGGVFELNLNTLELEGEITVDGATIGFCGGTSGTGGSIKATITGEMTGDGTFSANAGRCTNTATDASGGRIAIYYTTAGGINAEAPEDEYTLQAVNLSPLPSTGSPGTIYLEDMSLVPVTYATGQGRLIITEGGFTHNSPIGVPLPATVDLYELEIDAATVTMTPTDTAQLNINNLLDIRNSGVLTYTDMVSLGPIKRLIIDASGKTVQVDATSLIDARGKGAIFNEQIDPDSSLTNAVAGFNRSHGGLGDSLEGVDKVYGDFWDPQYPGSGGQSLVFNGGGYIRILADTFTHNGTIRADGSHGGCAGPPGSGGSIKIVTTGVLGGSGTIQANAGNCTNTVSGSAAGRVAFFYTTAGSINATPPDQLFSIQARNENIQANLGDASPGTVYIEDANAIPGTYASGEGILIIDNGSTDVGHTDGVPLLGTVNLYELRINHANVTAETLNVANTLTLSDQARLKPQAMVTLGPIRRLDINAENAAVSIDATSFLDAQGRGTVGTDKIDPVTSTTNAIDGSKTSHGGVGGTDPSEAYGDFFNPIYPGSGGTFSGSRAGGVIDLHANTLDLAGTITASASVHGGCGGTAASGGSVKITIDSTYTGSGIISADSGNCTNSSSTASGGRVAVFYTTAGSINATPPDQQYTISTYALDSQGSAGTVYIEDANAVTLGTYTANQGRLIIKDVSSTSATTGVPLLGTVNVYDLVINQAKSTAETIIAKNIVSLTNSATLRHEGMSSLGAIKRLTINSPDADLTIDGTSTIALNGLGAIANQQIDPSSSTTNAVSGANNAHGGIVGTGYSAAYGDFRNPLYPGSGGSTFGSPFGGGYASINVAGFAFDGTITANGNNAGCGGTTGAGGAVKVTTSGELTGSGTISATGSTCTNSGGIGAGGRIAFFYDSDPAGVVTNASPETLYTLDTTYNGTNTPGPGTIYIEDDNATNGDPDNQGDLIINGEGVTVYSTPIFTDETPTALTLTNVTVINNADLILTSPCTASLTITGTIDLSGGGSITDNTAGACALNTSALNITPSTLDSGVSGIAYSDSVESAGGYAPKTYQCLDGLGGSVIACDAAAGLPNGTTMSAAGLVSGTPTATGTFNFVVRVTDSDPGGAATDEETMQITIGVPPNEPTLVSPTNGGTVNLLAPELEANYSDNDAGDTGTTEFRVSTSSTTDCVNNVNVVASGSSAISPDNNENLTYTVSPNLTDLTTYYWCARNNDGVATSNSGAYTPMGEFTVDLTFVPGGSSPQKQQAIQNTNNQNTQTPTDTTDNQDSTDTTAPEEPTTDPNTETPSTEPTNPVEEPTTPIQPNQPDNTLQPSLPQEEQDEAPGDNQVPPPQPPPTTEESTNLDGIVDELINDEDQSSSRPVRPQTPSESRVTTDSQSDGRSFTIEVQDTGDQNVQGDEEELVITGLATTDQDRIEFTGTTSEPNTTVTLIFNDTITIVVTSDEEGFWQTFVSADQLGITDTDRASVKVDAIAAKDGLRSSKVTIGQIALELRQAPDTDVKEVVAEFQTITSTSMLISDIRAITTRVQEVIEEQEVVIQQTLTVTAPVVVVASAPLWSYLPYLPTMLYHFIPYLFGLIGRRKQEDNQEIGLVYDSITKQPLSLAVIRLYKQNQNGESLVTTVVTDKSGHYTALLEPGSYRAELKKPQYTFPSKIVTVAPTFTVNEDKIENPSFPMDPINVKDQFAVANIFKKLWLLLQKAGHYLVLPLLFIGSFVSALAVMSVPESIENWILAILYILLFLLQLRLRPVIEKAWGVVYDLATSGPLPLTTIQLVSPEYGKVVTSRLTDYEGRFAFMPEPGRYIVKASKEGFEQVEVVESGDKDHQPITGEVQIQKEGQRIEGDIAMRQS